MNRKFGLFIDYKNKKINIKDLSKVEHYVELENENEKFTLITFENKKDAFNYIKENKTDLNKLYFNKREVQKQMKLTDLVEIKEKEINLEDIAIAKRQNNNKRNFLFVNKNLGKHYPTKGKDVLKQFELLYNKITKVIDSKERLLVIGFAETATALGQYICYKNNIENKLNIVHYVQTTREEILAKTIDFQEEHSHATEQTIYLKNIPEFDRILFIEDEITTGKTIDNFIKVFGEDTKYSIASILNWKSQNNEKYISLVNGELKDNNIEINENYNVEELRTPNNLEFNAMFTVDFKDPRIGLSKEDIKEYFDLKIPENIKKTDKVLVLGTEENMFKAILLSSLFENGYTQSTTRSPIEVSDDKEYPFFKQSILSSAYDNFRETYLYNFTPENYDNVIVYTDMTIVNPAFKEELINKCKNITFI